MGLKPDSPLPAVSVGLLVDGSLPGEPFSECVRRGGGYPSMGSCACPTRPPAHPAKNTAGLKPDPPTVWPAPGSRLSDAWLPPYPPCPGRTPYTTPMHQDRMQEIPEPQRSSQGTVLGPEPGPALYPLPSVNPTAPLELPGWHRALSSLQQTLCPARLQPLAQAPDTQGPSAFLCGFVFQLQATLGPCLLDKNRPPRPPGPAEVEPDPRPLSHPFLADLL